VAARDDSDGALDVTVATDRNATKASSGGPLAGRGARELPQVAADRYQVSGEVGRGGLGRVLRARDEVLDRTVALKELFAADDGSRRRFVREALITARLQHPAIVPVYDAGRREDLSPFYAMKLVKGQPLSHAIADATALPKRLALVPTVLAVADAIAYAHSEHIIHRDLKPGNVLLGDFGETVVIDWGLAKDLSFDDRDALPAGPYRNDNVEHTVAGSVLGTPGYMAPEQAAGEEVDERADVYALGAILYHVVSGALPHPGTLLEDVIARVIKGDIRPVLEVEPEVPPDLAAIIGKAMATDKAGRYRTARELADDLRRFQTGQLVGAHRYTRTERIARWVRKHRAIAMVTAIAAIVLLGFGTWSILRILAERDAAFASERLAIARERDAIAKSNTAILDRARAARDRDPAVVLAVLKALDTRGPGWDAARVLAAEALAHPRLLHELHSPERLHWSRDGRRGFGFLDEQVWLVDLERGTSSKLGKAGYQPEGGVCDDGRRGLALVGDIGVHRLAELDLIAGTFAEKAPMLGSAWAKLLGACNTERALVLTATGVSWRDPATGAEIQLTATPPEAGWVTPDHKHAVILDRDGTLRRVDLTGKELASIAGPPPEDPKALPLVNPRTGWVLGPSVAMSLDGSVVITSVRDRALYWTFTHGRAVVLPIRSPDGLAVLPDGSKAYAATDKETWVTDNVEAPVPTKDGNLPAGALSLSPDGAWLGAVANDEAWIVDLIGGGVRRLVTPTKIKRLDMLAGGRFATFGNDTVRVWELGAPARAHGRARASVAAFSPDGTKIAIWDREWIVRRDVDGARVEVHRREEGPNDTAIAIADSGKLVYTIQARVFEWLPGEQQPQAIGAHEEGGSLQIAVLRDGTPITLSKNRLAIWRPTARFIALPKARVMRESQPSKLELDEAGTRALVSCNPDGEVRRTCMVDLTSATTAVLEGARGPSAMSASGRVAITGGEGDTYLLWDLDRRSHRPPATGVGEVTAVGMSRDGTRAVVGGARGLDLVDVGSSKASALGGGVATGRLLFSPDNRTLVDDALHVWDVASGERRQIIHGDSQAHHLGDRGLASISWRGLLLERDELPRAPAALAAMLAKQPYKLDGHGSLVQPIGAGPR
jgi:hypothetical protein